MSYQQVLNQNRHVSLRQQKGVVIIVALFIVALVATLSILMMSRFARDTQALSLVLRYTQASYYAEGSLAWAKGQLRRNYEQRRPHQLVDQLPLQSDVNVVNGYAISSKIIDLNGLYNINNLESEKTFSHFKRLLHAIDPKLSEQELTTLILNIHDWISSKSRKAELARFYAEQKPPYRAGYQKMKSVTELKRVKGMTAQLYQLLAPHLVALPRGDTKVNINTATAAVLNVIDEKINDEAILAILQRRMNKPFAEQKEFLELPIIQALGIKDEQTTVLSGYFLVETTVQIENQKLVIYSMLERAVTNQKAKITMVWQSKGIW